MTPLDFLGWALVLGLGINLVLGLLAAWRRRRVREHRRALRAGMED